MIAKELELRCPNCGGMECYLPPPTGPRTEAQLDDCIVTGDVCNVYRFKCHCDTCGNDFDVFFPVEWREDLIAFFGIID